MGVRIERYRHEFFPALQQFLLASYPASPLKADERYFQWRFAEDPRGSSLDHYYLALDEDRVVGQWCSLVDRVWVGRQWRDALWLIDLMIDPAYRRTGALLGLAKAVMTSGKLCLAVGAAEHMVPLYDALRWRKLRLTETYYAPLRPSRLADLAASTGRASETLQRLAPVLKAADWIGPKAWQAKLAMKSSARDLRIEEWTAFPPEVDALVAKNRACIETTIDRSAAILNWKFNQRPVGSHIALAACDASDGRLRGYLVAKWMQREGVRWAEVADFLTEPGDATALGRLIDAVIGRALAKPVDFLRLRCGLPEHQQLLKRPWWIQKTTPVVDETFVYDRDVGLLDALAALPWRLTSLASDRVDYGRDNWNDKIASQAIHSQ